MKLDVAGVVKEILLSSAQKLDRSIAWVVDEGDPEAAALYKRVAGKVMGLIYINLLMPIYREHPELEPPELRSQAVRRPHLTPSMSDELIKLNLEVDHAIRDALERIGSEDVDEMKRYGKFAEEIFQAIRDVEMLVKHVRQSDEEDA